MPSSFPQRRLLVDFSQVDMSPRLNRLLQGLLQPAWEDRLTATQAKAVLTGNAPSSSQQSQRQRQQKGWNVFHEGAWEDRRQRSRGSSSSQVRLLVWLLLGFEGVFAVSAFCGCVMPLCYAFAAVH